MLHLAKCKCFNGYDYVVPNEGGKLLLEPLSKLRNGGHHG